jgi:hypothetical protein
LRLGAGPGRWVLESVTGFRGSTPKGVPGGKCPQATRRFVWFVGIEKFVSIEKFVGIEKFIGSVSRRWWRTG